MSQEEFQKLVLNELKSIKDEIKEVKKEIKDVKKIVIRTEEQTKENTEFITAIKQIAKQ